MFKVLIFSLLISYAVSMDGGNGTYMEESNTTYIEETAAPALISCMNDTYCDGNQCCLMDAASNDSLGTCQAYQQEGEPCSGCGCKPGLIFDSLIVISRAAQRDNSSSSSLLSPFPPAYGICRRRRDVPPAKPTRPRGKKCFASSECPRNHCCSYGGLIASKRFALFSGVCRPYPQNGGPC